MKQEDLYKLIRDDKGNVLDEYKEFIQNLDEFENEGMIINGITFEFVASIGGGEGGARRVQQIFKVAGTLYREEGEYDSYEGTQYYGLGSPSQVEEREKTIKIYVAVKNK